MSRGNNRAATSPLALVGSPEAEQAPRVQFCSHCGTRPPLEAAVAARVCDKCSLGLLLESAEDAAPGPKSAFIVIDASLAVCAVSREAERLLATTEIDAVNRHLTELIVPADAEAQGPQNLAVAVTWAARGDEAPRRVFVRPANTFGIRLGTRIANCGPPKAALLVFD